MKKADNLGQFAPQHETVDPGIEYIPHYVKRGIKEFVNSSISNDLVQGCADGSLLALGRFTNINCLE